MYLDKFKYRFLSRLILGFFCRPSPQLSILDMILADCKQLPNFPALRKSTLCKWCRKMVHCVNGAESVSTILW